MKIGALADAGLRTCRSFHYDPDSHDERASTVAGVAAVRPHR
jgi:hypothetical protein